MPTQESIDAIVGRTTDVPSSMFRNPQALTITRGEVNFIVQVFQNQLGFKWVVGQLRHFLFSTKLRIDFSETGLTIYSLEKKYIPRIYYKCQISGDPITVEIDVKSFGILCSVLESQRINGKRASYDDFRLGVCSVDGDRLQLRFLGESSVPLFIDHITQVQPEDFTKDEKPCSEIKFGPRACYKLAEFLLINEGIIKVFFLLISFFYLNSDAFFLNK